ncbi:DNA-binding transcriptional MocR family regulator [Deinococcus metalli]|uniref:Aminotransferase n=1 Tax=Deinococcus metalli TaxID=1141878 RepID=A0A7W8NSB9_9DEIO|nr:PLP-dependent aminotransferase family protein [Deinococcus metalli]MBB5377823.1 DNA-binding transcriptional MocR family regulator [Deinococcus metalli]GHF55677.1 aminotransferase [Deinococcus metalli]
MSPVLKSVQTTLAEGVIELGVGHPTLDLLPLDFMREAAAHRFAQGDPSFLQYGAEWGDGALRTELAAFLTGQYAFPVDPQELFISGGVSQALDLICAMFTQPGDTIIVEDPTYFLALDIFRGHRLKIVSVPVDAHGLDVDTLAALVQQHRPRLVYIIPTHQNPTGATLTAERREALVRLAQEHDFLVVADEVYHLLTYGDPPPPSLAAHVGTGQVLSLGSFSKILAPGTRLGWISARADRLETLARNGMVASGGGFSPLGSAVIRSMLELGLLARYVQGLRDTFRERAAALTDALRSLPVTFQVPQGGYFVWVTLPDGLDSAALLERAVREGVRYQPGNRFSPDHTQGDRARLCFAYYAEAELRDGAARLGRAIEASRPGSHADT